MRRTLTIWVVVAFTAALPCRAEEQRDQQLGQLNRILALLVRAEVISQKLTLDQVDLREVLGERGRLDAEIREAVGATFSEGDLAQLEEMNPERARRERVAGLAREAKLAELRSQREALENNIRVVRARIDNSISRLDAIDKLLSELFPEDEPAVRKSF